MLRHDRHIESAFAVLWLLLLIPSVVAFARGESDTYHNQHWRGATLAAAMLLSALGALSANRRLRYALWGLSVLLLALSLWLII